MRLVQFLARTALTVWLLVLVYRGSRVALVVVLGLICVVIELHALVVHELREWR